MLSEREREREREWIQVEWRSTHMSQIPLYLKDYATGATGCPEGIWGNRHISHRPFKNEKKKKEKEIEALASATSSTSAFFFRINITSQHQISTI